MRLKYIKPNFENKKKKKWVKLYLFVILLSQYFYMCFILFNYNNFIQHVYKQNSIFASKQKYNLIGFSWIDGKLEFNSN